MVTAVKSDKMIVKMSTDEYKIDMERDNYMIAVDREPPPEDGYYVVEEMPGYQNGTDGIKKYLQENMRYPDDAEKNGIEGTVNVSFVVGNKGEVKDAEVVESVNKSLDKEALRLVYGMTGWIPGKQRSKPVFVRMILPVTFKLK